MSNQRAAAIERARSNLNDGQFLKYLGQRVSVKTQSSVAGSLPDLNYYLDQTIAPDFRSMGFDTQTFANEATDGGPFLVASRIESDDLPTIFCYGHGDVVPGMEGAWSEGRDPWTVTIEGDRIYGRGTADNKGQHTINMTALEAVLAERGELGFNMKFLVETSEETGSPGLREFCQAKKDLLAADVLIASDGPRVAVDTPTMVLGVRGAMEFSLVADLRQEDHHSGNWGGILVDPSILLSYALSTIISREGRILIPEWLPKNVPDYVKESLVDCPFDPGESADMPDHEWGEPGLSVAERLYAWNSFSVLAMEAGEPTNPQNAIPKRAALHCGLRFIVGTETDKVLPALRAHLDKHGFDMIRIEAPADSPAYQASRHDPNLPWVKWAGRSIEATMGRTPQILPNAAGSLPNDIFCDVLDMPTLWVPHSYNSCGQHAPDEHLLMPLVEEGLAMMTGIFWDAGELGGAFQSKLMA